MADGNETPVVEPVQSSVASGVPHVYQGICDVMSDIAREGIAKNRKNVQQGNQFRGIDDVYNAMCGLFAKNRICVLPVEIECRRHERETSSNKTLYCADVKITFKIVSAVDASFQTIQALGEGSDMGDKTLSKCESIAYKYAVMQAFCIPTQATPDTDNDTPEDSNPRGKQPPATTQRSAPPAAAPAQRPAAAAPPAPPAAKPPEASQAQGAGPLNPPKAKREKAAPPPPPPSNKHLQPQYQVFWELLRESPHAGMPFDAIPVAELTKYQARLEVAVTNPSLAKYKPEAELYKAAVEVYLEAKRIEEANKLREEQERAEAALAKTPDGTTYKQGTGEVVAAPFQ